MPAPKQIWISGPRASGKTKTIKSLCWKVPPSERILCITPWLEEKILWQRQWEKLGGNNAIEIHTPESLAKKLLDQFQLTNPNWTWHPSYWQTASPSAEHRRTKTLRNQEMAFDIAHEILQENLDQIANLYPWDWLFYEEPEERSEDIQQWISQIPRANLVVSSKWRAPNGWETINLTKSFRGTSSRGERLVEFEAAPNKDNWLRTKIRYCAMVGAESDRNTTTIAVLTGNAASGEKRQKLLSTLQNHLQSENTHPNRTKVWVMTPPEVEGKIFDYILIPQIDSENWSKSKELTEAWLDLACSKSRNHVIASYPTTNPPIWLRSKILSTGSQRVTFTFPPKTSESLCQRPPLFLQSQA